LNAAVRQHPHLEKTLGEERYREAVEYCNGTYHDTTDAGWYRLKPRLVVHLERQEVRRVEHERDLPEEALSHRVDPETVKRALADVRDLRKPEIAELSDVVERLYRANKDPENHRVHYAELYQVGVRLSDDRFRDAAQAIRENRTTVEKTLNERLGLEKDSNREVRIAVADNRLYYWTVDLSLDNWSNSLAAQKMYFRSKEDKFEFIEEMRKQLHIRGGTDASQYYLNDLACQLSRLEDPSANRFGRYWIHHYFDGETIHLVVDTLGVTLDDVKGRIGHMGISERGCIKNPQFPEIHKWRMKTVAIIESDGSLEPNGQLRYFEDVRDRDRCMIAYRIFCEFGDFKFKPYIRPDQNDNCIKVELPMVIGALMRNWGVPPGDKAIYNWGLHPCIINEPLEVRIHYLPEMVAQDGCFSRGRYQITRDHAIDAGRKKEAYRSLVDHVPELSAEEIELVKKYGKPIPASLGYGPGDRIGLTMRAIQDLAESEDRLVSETAQRLRQAAESTPNRLLDDEVHRIIEPLGIHMRVGPIKVQYFKGTGRVSVVSEAHTLKKEDALRWSLIAPPNHPRKMKAVVGFVQKHPEDVREIKAQIEKEGLKVHPIWEDYRIE